MCGGAGQLWVEAERWPLWGLPLLGISRQSPGTQTKSGFWGTGVGGELLAHPGHPEPK